MSNWRINISILTNVIRDDDARKKDRNVKRLTIQEIRRLTKLFYPHPPLRGYHMDTTPPLSKAKDNIQVTASCDATVGEENIIRPQPSRKTKVCMKANRTIAMLVFISCC